MSNPAARRTAEQWASVVQTGVEPLLIRKYLFAYLFPPESGPDREAIGALVPKVEAHFDVLEPAVRQGAIGKGAFTLVDAYLVPILAAMTRTPEGGEALPRREALHAYLGSWLSRPSVQATMPPAS